ncbi:MAG: hypothetical protein ABSE22_23005 [Xanthobacteraceae bacterium]
MTTKTDMRRKIMIGIAALAIGAAATSVPAFAYTPVPGYNSEGGVIAIPHKHHSAYNKSHRALYNRSLPKGGTTP